MIQKELERRLVTVNTKRVRRLMHEENLVIQVQWTPLSRPKSCVPSLLFRQAVLAPTPYTSAGVR
jgi:hypothetical protein